MIESVCKDNLPELLPLMRNYQEFYKVANISEEKNRTFFSQFGESSAFGCQFLFRYSGMAVGFATVYFTFASTLAEKVAVLNDLFVLPDHRGKGIARQLIEHSYNFAVNKGASRLQWVTAPDNEHAQKLYDAMGANKSTWQFYTYKK